MKHFKNVEKNELAYIATLLDPRYKTSVFQDKNNARLAKEKLSSIMISFLNKEKVESQQTSSSESSSTTIQMEEVFIIIYLNINHIS